MLQSTRARGRENRSPSLRRGPAVLVGFRLAPKTSRIASQPGPAGSTVAVVAELHLTGCMNNALCDLVAPFEWGRHVDLASCPPTLHWDPVLAALGVLGLLLDPPVEPGPAWARTVLLDDQGREVGAWTVSGELSEAGYRGQFLSAVVRIEPREQIVRVEGFQVIAMQVEHRVVATSAWQVGSGSGSQYAGVSTACWEGTAVAGLRAGTVAIRRSAGSQLIRLEWAAATEW